jgi:hypothetical protein
MIAPKNAQAKPQQAKQSRSPGCGTRAEFPSARTRAGTCMITSQTQPSFARHDDSGLHSPSFFIKRYRLAAQDWRGLSFY